ncbi:MAG TPA: MFS transporter [Ktedonobacteraceae bacterium]|nr:MFS transporter [Ktedonobacteraceae bacterium]
MLALLSQRNFCLLWVAHTISIVGDYVFFIAITFWIYEQTSSASATGAVLITSTLPALIFAPLVGVVVDRWPRRGIMLVAESARAGLFLALLGAVMLRPEMIWPIYVAGFAQSALAAFFWPARSALLPQLIKPSALLASNALYMLSDSGVRILAPSLSTFILLRSGPPGVIIIDITTFLISAGSVCLLALPLPQPRATSLPASKRSFFSRWPERMLGLKAWPVHVPGGLPAWIGILFLPMAIMAWTAGTLNILFPSLARAILEAGPVAYGWLLTAQALGEGAVCLALGQGQRDRRRLPGTLFVSGGLVGGGLALLLMAWNHALILNLAFNLIFGAATAATTMQLSTMLQECVPNRSLGRVLAIYTAFQTLAQIAGMVGAGLVPLPAGIPWLLMLNGALYLLGSLFWLLSRRAKQTGG